MIREFDLKINKKIAHIPPWPWLIYPPDPWRSRVRGYLGHLLTVCKVFAYGVVGPALISSITIISPNG